MYYLDLDAIRKKGVAVIAKEFLNLVAEKKLDGFWIHLDVDVLNDEVMPCVDSRSEDGLWYSELKEMMGPLLQSVYFTGMEITILDPTLDKEGIYTKQFADEIAEVLNS